MTPEQIKAERKAFEKDRRRIGWDKHMLRRHSFGKTWFGRKAVMPAYLDNWAEAQWIGWRARAEQALRDQS